MSNTALTYRDYDNIQAGLKAQFPQHKSYSLRRGDQLAAVLQLVEQHGLDENQDQGGWVQCTPSIYFSWSVYQHVDRAVFLYQDGGMGWDKVMLMGSNRAALESLKQTGIQLGLVKLRKNKG